MLKISGKQVKSSVSLEVTDFQMLRKLVARALDPEVYEHYCAMNNIFGNIEDLNAYDDRTKLLTKQFSDYSDVIDFLYMYDIDGEIGYKTCTKILNLLEGHFSESEMPKLSEFRTVLKECSEKKHRMCWIEQ